MSHFHLPEPSRCHVVRRARSIVTCPRCGDGRPRNQGSRGARHYYSCRRCCEAPEVPFSFSVDEDRGLDAVLPEGCWRGEAVWIVGGGRSAKGWNPREAWPSPTIAINDAWRLFEPAGLTPTVSWSADQLWLRDAARDWDYRDAVALRVAPGLDMAIPRGVWVAPARDEPGHWPSRLAEGLRVAACSGLGALCLADALGASRIVLVGHDLDGVTGQGHPAAAIHSVFLDRFREIAPMVSASVEVRGESPLASLPWGDRRVRL